jgi:hypothetical protein
MTGLERVNTNLWSLIVGAYDHDNMTFGEEEQLST